MDCGAEESQTNIDWFTPSAAEKSMFMFSHYDTTILKSKKLLATGLSDPT